MMELWQTRQDLAQLIADKILGGREDAEAVGEEIACAIHELINAAIAEKTGAC